MQHLILTSCVLEVFFSLVQLLQLNISEGNSIFAVLVKAQYIMNYIRGPLCIIAISYSLAEIYYNEDKNINIKPITVCIISLLSVLIINLRIYDISNINYNLYFLYESIMSMFFTLLSTEIFIKLCKRYNKYTVDINKTYNYYINKGISSFLPSIITIVFIIVIKILIVDIFVTNISTVNSNNIYSVITETIILQLSWFFGGNSVFFDYSNEVMQHYVLAFAHIGGAGSTLSLIIAFKFIKSIKNKRKVIPNIGVVASIFNINEPIVYGLPIIFNPIYIIPFIFTPVVLFIVTYVAISINFISINNIDINWSMPVFLNAYILTNSFKGVILQVINILIGIAIYTPFVILSEKVYEIEINDFYEDLKSKIFSNELDGKILTLLDDNIGIIARILAVDLSNDLINNKRLYLQYQPQVNKSGTVVGVESLCRWNHKILGNIPPNIFIQIAEECGLMNELGRYIIKESCNQLKLWNKELSSPIEMSINISPSQLKDENFYEYIKGIVENNSIEFTDIKLEITESLSLGHDIITDNQIKRLSRLGIKFAIDDFGQGYNPILYLKKYNINTLKLDGSLIKDIESNEDSRYIVHAMYTLCENSDITIVCEYVEEQNQKLILDKMGDGIYQGYLFSEPLDNNECLIYIKKHSY